MSGMEGPPNKKEDLPSRRKALDMMVGAAAAVGAGPAILPRLSKTLKTASNSERVHELRTFFTEAEQILESEGREDAKTLLSGIYTTLQWLNVSDAEWTNIWDWNPEGGLTNEEFDELNLRRKKLSNAIGILTRHGTIRHNLNPDV
jgi:hypothetical protein